MAGLPYFVEFLSGNSGSSGISGIRFRLITTIAPKPNSKSNGNITDSLHSQSPELAKWQ